MTAGTDDFAAFAAVLDGIAMLPDQELAHLRRHAEVRTFHAGQALLDMGEVPTRCWFLASGQALSRLLRE